MEKVKHKFYLNYLYRPEKLGDDSINDTYTYGTENGFESKEFKHY